MKILTKLVTLFFILTCSIELSAQENEQETFLNAYQAYEDAIASGDIDRAIRQAKISYDLGKNIYGSDNFNTALLAINYGNIVNNVDIAEIFLNEGINIQEQVYGKKSLELVPALRSLAKLKASNASLKQSEKTYKRLLSIAKKSEINATYTHGLYYYEAGITLFTYDEGSSTKTAYAHLKRAEKIFETLSTKESNEHLAITKEWLGRYQMLRGNLNTASALFLEAIALLTTSSPNSKEIFTIRTFLVDIFQRTKKSEDATIQIQAMIDETPSTIETEIPPKNIYSKAPEYSYYALSRNVEGWILLSYMVDVNGKVQNPIISDSDFTGDSESHKTLSEESINAVLNFRYVPRLISGIPVETEDVRHIFRFQIPD